MTRIIRSQLAAFDRKLISIQRIYENIYFCIRQWCKSSALKWFGISVRNALRIPRGLLKVFRSCKKFESSKANNHITERCKGMHTP